MLSMVTKDIVLIPSRKGIPVSPTSGNAGANRPPSFPKLIVGTARDEDQLPKVMLGLGASVLVCPARHHQCKTRFLGLLRLPYCYTFRERSRTRFPWSAFLSPSDGAAKRIS